MPIVDDKRCNEYLEKGRHSFSFRFAVNERAALEKTAVEFTQKAYVLNGYPHGKGKKERNAVIALSNENVVLVSLRKVDAGVYEIRLFNNCENGTECISKIFGKEILLQFGKYEVKTLFYKDDALMESASMLVF